MRRAGARLLGLARHAAAGGLQNAEAVCTCEPAACSSRTVWLRPPGGRRAATAAGGTPPPTAAAAAVGPLDCGTPRGITSSSTTQHTAQPAHAEVTQQQRQEQPAEQRQERTCWQCGTPLTAQVLFFCPACRSVLPASMDVQYFKVFEM